MYTTSSSLSRLHCVCTDLKGQQRRTRPSDHRRSVLPLPTSSCSAHATSRRSNPRKVAHTHTHLPHSSPYPLAPPSPSPSPLPCPLSASKLSKSSSSSSLHTAVAAAESSNSLAPPRGKARRKTTMDDDALPDDDALSTTSTSSSSSLLDLTAPLPSILLSPSSNSLHDILERLPEKRSAIRVAALEQLLELLTSTYLHDSLARQVETLTLYTLNCVKRGDTREVELATRTLSLIAVSCDEGDETVWKAAAPTLREWMKNRSHGWAARAAAVRALTFLSFILSQHPDESMELMDALLALLPASPHAASTAGGGDVLDVAVFDSWGLLASTLPDHVLSGFLVTLMPRFTAYLHSDSVEVRMSVGEDVAMLFSVYHAQHAQQGEDDDEEENEDGAEPAPAPPVLLSPTDHHHAQPSPRAPSEVASSYSVLSASLRHDLLPLLQSLSTDSSRYRARKERKEQRATFRDILDSVETGEEPVMAVEVKKQRLEVVGWREMKRWVAVRDVVGKGVGVHVADNPLVQAIVGWEVEGEATDGGALDGLDDKTRKALARSQSRSRAKEAYQHHNKQRAKKRAQVMGED